FLYRCFFNTRVLHRCDAGISRFVMEKNGKVFGCPAASMYNFLELINLDYHRQLESQIREQKNQCLNCPVFFLCGGECRIESINYDGKNPILCEFKKELIGLAMYIKLVTLFDYFSVFQEIYEFCEEKSKRKYAI
ncbi:MAG: SPASM domain-containing protein, partial [Anaeroplasmataceae bacterium]|nr:SPASM domain-containing protein [Anaeroplasmataceae bacterium]